MCVTHINSIERNGRMNESFSMIKTRRLAEAVINTVVIALSSGALVFGAMMLAFKLLMIEFPLLYHILISCCTGLVAGAVTFLICKRSPMKIAREIDTEYRLGEKIQTMVAFENEKSDILTLQREDAEASLSRLNTRKPFSKRFGTSVAAMLLAVAIMTPAVLIPMAAPPEEDDTPPIEYEEPFRLSTYQEEALANLIENVKKRDIDVTLKEEIVTELTRLLGVLKTTSLLTLMTGEVTASIIVVDLATEEKNTYKLICETLFEGSTDEQVRNIAKSIVKLNGIAFGEDMKVINEYYRGDTVIKNEDDTPTQDGDEGGEPVTLSDTSGAGNSSTESSGEETVITLAEKLDSLSTEIPRVLADGKIPAEDKMRLALIAFALDVAALKSEANPNTQQSLIDTAFDKVIDDVSNVLAAQYENKQARDYVIKKLVEIFEIERPKDLLGDKIPLLIDSEQGDGQGDTSSGISGGYGKGEELYGSNDTIYDPFGENGAGYVKYGDAFDTYYPRIEELIAPSNTSVSEETKKILMLYFQKLSDGSGN